MENQILKIVPLHIRVLGRQGDDEAQRNSKLFRFKNIWDKRRKISSSYNIARVRYCRRSFFLKIVGLICREQKI